MIIIADGGSTKTNWCLVTEEGKKVYFNTEGYNPYFAPKDYIIQSLKESLPNDLEKDNISEVNTTAQDALLPRCVRLLKKLCRQFLQI
jgi:N-acetylglucosamine kinase-like BadF-type ATPase